ncbi:MAG: hypothetical protein LAO05_11670 [Acidobacteriia bacterium]|nr:hypothetical protein [Terriglobia bacterium]
MKKLAALVVVLLAWTVSASAKEYQSSFGFTLAAPDNWLVLTKQEIANNPELAGPPGVSAGRIDPQLKAVESGSNEFLYDRTTSDATFSDNINVRLGGKGEVPGTPEAVKAQCTAYGQALNRVAGRTLAIAKCEDRDMGASKAFYVEYEGRVAGTVAMQYQFVRRDGRLVFVTATCKTTSLDKFRPEFEAIVRSIRLN